MPSKKYRTYYSEKEKVYAIQEIKENIIALECDITKIHKNLKSIGREIYYLYDAITESSESSTSESSSAEEEAYTIEEEPRESVFTPLNKVKCIKKRSGNKKVKRKRYPSRSVNVKSTN